MTYKYAYQHNKDHEAIALGKDLPISSKQSIEICKYLRGKKVSAAKKILADVAALKKAVPYTRFHGDMGHKPGIGPGRYPGKASLAILQVLTNAEANAQNKGLDAEQLHVVHLMAQEASRPWRYGRQRRIKAKRTHIEVVVAEHKDASR